MTAPLFQNQDGIITTRVAPNTVQAGYVGELISTQGQITIMRNGVATTSSQLQ
jgi:hypothetical protein